VEGVDDEAKGKALQKSLSQAQGNQTHAETSSDLPFLKFHSPKVFRLLRPRLSSFPGETGGTQGRHKGNLQPALGGLKGLLL
jgi:hypothetical protein